MQAGYASGNWKILAGHQALIVLQDTGGRILAAGYGLQDTGCRIQVTGYGLQDTGWKIRVAGYGLQDTGPALA